MRVYILQRYHRRRDEAKEFLGGVCVRCGTKEDLDLDHIDRTAKTGNIGKLWSYDEEKFWTEVKKCQLLCREHHIVKTREAGDGRPWRHGTQWAWDKHKCRCEECCIGHQEVLEMRRAKRKNRTNQGIVA